MRGLATAELEVVSLGACIALFALLMSITILLAEQ
jgi:hypothetical protein